MAYRVVVVLESQVSCAVPTCLLTGHSVRGGSNIIQSMTKYNPCTTEIFLTTVKIENHQLFFFIFPFLHYSQNIRCVYMLEPPALGVLSSTHNRK